MADWNTSLTGMDKGRRRGPGWPRMTFWTLHCLSISSETTLSTPHPEAVATPVATVGRQDPPLEEGVMSGKLCHHSPRSHQPQCTPDPNHLHSNHPHLLLLIKLPISLHSSHSLIVRSTVLSFPTPYLRNLPC